MPSFDWTWLGNLVLSSTIGALASWIVSKYYFHKISRAEQIADQLKGGLQKALIPILYPCFFDNENVLTVYPKQSTPTNLDIPHVEYATFSSKFIGINQRTDVLIKIKDDGFDLDTPRGVTVRDHKDNSLGILPLGLGYVTATFNTMPDDRPGSYSLTVELEDLEAHTKSPNRCTQSLPFTIGARPIAAGRQGALEASQNKEKQHERFGRSQ